MKTALSNSYHTTSIRNLKTKLHILEPWISILLFLTTLCTCCACPLQDLYAHDDKNLNWKTIQTENFAIHFPDIYLEFAQYVAKIAEEAHQTLSPIFLVTPQVKTQIAISSYSDEFNGSATIVPKNIIQIYAFPPNASSELSDYDDWVRSLVYHEYAHLLQMSTIGKFHTFINRIFGQIASANIALPRWYLEGLAIATETLFSNAGRIRNTLYRTILYKAALHNNIPSLAELSNEPHEWPGTSPTYLFGAFFIHYLQKKFGFASLIHFNHAYAKSWIPYGLNRTALQVWQQNLDELYTDWKTNATAQALATKTTLQAQHTLTPHQILPISYRNNNTLAIRPNHQNTISYYRNDGKSRNKIVIHSLDTGETTELFECHGSCKHIWSHDGNKLLFIQATYKNSLYYTHDLYLYDTITKKTKQLTHNLRVKDFDWIQPTNNSQGFITIVSQQGPKANILKLEPQTNQTTHLYNAQLLEQLDDLQIIDNTHLLFSRFDPNTQKRRISILNLEKQNWIHLTHDKAQNIAPYIQKDANTLWFISDKTGFFNLYSMDLNTYETTRRTHLDSAILEPRFDFEKQTLYAITYTNTGLVPMRINMRDFIKKDINDSKEQSKRTQKYIYPPLDSTPYNVQNYAPAHWLVPQRWSPIFAVSTDGISKLGIAFGASDSISHHSYDLSIAYDFWADYFETSANYTLSALPVDLIFYTEFKQYQNYFQDYEKIKTYDENRVYAYFAINGAISNHWTHHWLAAGYDLLWYGEHQNSVTWTLNPEAPVPKLPEFGFYNAIWVSWRMVNVRSFQNAISKSWGYDLSTRALLRAPFLGAQNYEATLTATIKGYIPMPWLENHVLAMRASAGVAYSEFKRRAPFALSTNTAFNLSSLLSASETDVVLRGYPNLFVQGKYYLYANLEYRCPIWYTSLAYQTVPVALKTIYASVFLDWAYAWVESPNFLASKASIGAELHFDIALGYNLIEHLRIGYAWGAAPGGNHQVYFLVGEFF